jgi:hypothetical protein
LAREEENLTAQEENQEEPLLVDAEGNEESREVEELD